MQQEQGELLCRMTGDHATLELMTFVGRSKFHEQVLAPLLALGVVDNPCFSKTAPAAPP